MIVRLLVGWCVCRMMRVENIHFRRKYESNVNGVTKWGERSRSSRRSEPTGLGSPRILKADVRSVLVGGC